MVKNLHHSLLSVFVLLSTYYTLQAQTDRTGLIKNDSPSAVSNPSLPSGTATSGTFGNSSNTMSQESKIAKELPASTKSVAKDAASDAVNANIRLQSSSTFSQKKGMNASKERITDEEVEAIMKQKALEAPIYPDLQVTATKEEPYENKVVAKESPSLQLERLERAPADNVQNSSVVSSNPNTVTISPLKRKYLEGVIKDLEKEIQEGRKTSLEIKAKKKELDDLKKLLE